MQLNRSENKISEMFHIVHQQWTKGLEAFAIAHLNWSNLHLMRVAGKYCYYDFLNNNDNNFWRSIMTDTI
jgi:hypothetical protein